jgi:hypothetical protein
MALMDPGERAELQAIGQAVSIESRIGLVGKRLASALRAVIDAMPGGPYRPNELARTLGIKKDLSSRVLRASRRKDPVAVVHLMPGPAPLRQLLRAAADKSVDPETLREGEEAVRQFDLLIHQEAGDRTSLDAIISTCLPDAREKFELFNKQAVHRGMAQLKGSMADVTANAAILHPAADGERLDGVWLCGLLGLRRIRPNAVVHFYSRQLGPSATTQSPLTLDREPVESLRGLLLQPFCSSPMPSIQAQHHGTTVHYMLASNTIGPQSAVDLFFAELTPRCMRRYRDGTQRMYGPSVEITTPTRTLIFDVLMHEDVYPGCEPTLLVYDTAVNGVAEMNDQARDIDRLDVVESVHALGRGSSKWRVSEMPDYVEVVRHVLQKLGWDGERFRGYRCRVQYPIYGSQVYLAFVAPENPQE